MQIQSHRRTHGSLFRVRQGGLSRKKETARDEDLKQSLMKYAIESGAITKRVYREEMELPIKDMKRFLDGILHICDEGRTAVKMSDLFGIVTEAESRLSEKYNSAAP